MKTEQAQPKKESKNRLMGAAMGLALVAGAVLSLGGAPPATSFTEVASPEGAAFVSATPDSISPGEEIADRDSLDLQLD